MRQLLLIISIFLCQLGYAQTAHDKVLTDIQYKTTKDAYVKERCKLDIYYNDTLKNCPVVVWYHGG